MKGPRRDGDTHRVTTPMEFMGRPSALVPPPRMPLARNHEVVAPNSPWRVAVMSLPPGGQASRVEARPAADLTTDAAGSVQTTGPGARIPLAQLLWQVWGIDALRCPAYEGRMTIVATLTARAGMVRGLEHLGLSTEVPRMDRARDGP